MGFAPNKLIFSAMDKDHRLEAEFSSEPEPEPEEEEEESSASSEVESSVLDTSDLEDFLLDQEEEENVIKKNRKNILLFDS